jgi:hypothetical protein
MKPETQKHRYGSRDDIIRANKPANIRNTNSTKTRDRTKQNQRVIQRTKTAKAKSEKETKSATNERDNEWQAEKGRQNSKRTGKVGKALKKDSPKRSDKNNTAVATAAARSYDSSKTEKTSSRN